ncbi:MAG: response regulator [Deltaproteobacteria bacterium]|jgi:signal transduction histidine kinase/CheY-like chemotaxis protein/outer membrane murein-binding lipoprotein Lpp|nr:response regulator [Deltaproteobacteria bacterium]
MKRVLTLSFQHKVVLVLVLLINIPFFLTGYMVQGLIKDTILQEKGDKLIALAEILNSRLGEDGFDGILQRHNSMDLPREEKLKILNEALSGITDEVGKAAPNLGIGYYSRDLDAIVTYGPSDLFGHNIGLRLPPDHPGNIVMSTGKQMISSGTMVRGDAMNAMIPIKRQGRVIGYIWCNEPTVDILAQLNNTTRNFTTFMLFCVLVTVGLMLALSRRTLSGVSRIMNGVRAMRDDLSNRIEETSGELGEVARDINAMASDIEKANKETRRAVAVFQRVLSNVDAYVYVCDPTTKILVYVNEALQQLLSDREVLRGRVCHQALYGSDQPCPSCPQKHLFDENGKPIFTPHRWERHSAALDRDFLMTDRLIIWHDGRLLHMQASTDVTYRKTLAVAEAANQAQRAFLARMSHEIRTPMNGVLGMTRLAMRADPPPVQLEYLKKIQASAELLLGIINDVLDFSRIEAGKLAIEKHLFNLRDLVENIRELILPQVQDKKLSLVINLDDSVPHFAVGDGLRLSQVLLNLMSNAVKFTPAGEITLSMSARPVTAGSLRLICSVRDSGIGITMDQQSALFRPFSQADISTSRKFGGTGLGLSISKALVEGMGGAISVTSVEGRGSNFYFHVLLEPADLAGKAMERLEAQNRLWEQARYDGCKFLLVEDNLINQEIALSILDELGAETDIANNGAEGVRAFLAKDYDLILMDVRMPVLDGLEATRTIRASGKHDALAVPIVAMTANALREDRESSAQAGMNGHVAKPIDLNELKSVIYQHVKK